MKIKGIFLFVGITGKFDIIISGCIVEESLRKDLLTTYLSLLNPGGHLFLYTAANSDKIKQVEHNLLISGFINTTVSPVKSFECKVEETAVQTAFPNVSEVTCIKTETPNYTVIICICFADLASCTTINGRNFVICISASRLVLRNQFLYQSQM